MNLETALAFYQDVIGFQVLEQTDRKAVLTTDRKNRIISA